MSLFDDAFTDAARTFADLFGDAGTYTIKATSTDVAVDLVVESDDHRRVVEQGSTWDVYTLVGKVLKSKISQPADGDLFYRSSDTDRIYKLTQTLVDGCDENNWMIELQHRRAVSHGGTAVKPPLFNV